MDSPEIKRDENDVVWVSFKVEEAVRDFSYEGKRGWSAHGWFYSDDTPLDDVLYDCLIADTVEHRLAAVAVSLQRKAIIERLKAEGRKETVYYPRVKIDGDDLEQKVHRTLCFETKDGRTVNVDINDQGETLGVEVLA